MNTTVNTMNNNNIIHPFVRDEVHFGFDLAPDVNALLQGAASKIATRKESLKSLIEAQKSAPYQIEVLVAMYKFYFYQGETEKAEELVFQTLIKSSLLGGFNYNWLTLTADSTDWNNPRKPGRVFLYSLKALAFIRLRQHNLKDAASILEVLQRLDPDDQIGADVVRDLLSGIEEEDDG